MDSYSQSQPHNCSVPLLVNTAFTTTSLLIQLVLLALLVLYKTYKTKLQRLFLYLTLSTVLNTLIQVCNVELQFSPSPSPSPSPSRDICAWIGFFSVWTDFLIELSSISLVFYLIAVTFQKLKGKQLCSFRKNLCSKRQKVLMEVVCTCLLVCLPLILIGWPFKYHLYGKSETVCWIKSKDDNVSTNTTNTTNTANTANTANTTMATFAYTIITLFETLLYLTAMISFMVLVLAFSVMLIKFRRSRAQNCQTMARAIFLMVVVGISIVYRICRLIVEQIGTRTVDVLYYDLIDNGVYELVKVLVPLGFALYLYSPSKLRIKSIKEAARKWPCYCSKKQPNLLVEEEGPGILEDSIARNAPSHTTYTSPHSSPYTNEFTDITEIVSSRECNKTPHYGTIPIIN